MDVPRIGNELVSYCKFNNHTNVSSENYESIMYFKNILNWIDIKYVFNCVFLICKCTSIKTNGIQLLRMFAILCVNAVVLQSGTQ